jgi:hypothetical protein
MPLPKPRTPGDHALYEILGVLEEIRDVLAGPQKQDTGSSGKVRLEEPVRPDPAPEPKPAPAKKAAKKSARKTTGSGSS